MKTLLITVTMALLACLVVLVLRRDEPDASVSGTPRSPSFEVRVVKPRSARPLFGLLPTGLFGLPASEQRFDNTSSGAEFGIVEPNRLELRADEWDLLIETDGEGTVAPDTRLVFTVDLGGRQLRLRCRPGGQPSGYLRTTRGAGADVLDGEFMVELANCENARTGKTIEWPPAPLTVRGSFRALPNGGN